MPSEDDLQWISVNDFTPGIYSGFFGSDGQPVKDGAARDTTYGCVGHPAGGLVPGPKLVRSFYENYPTASLVGSGEPIPDGPVVITGFGNLTPIRFDSASSDYLPVESTEPVTEVPDFAFVSFSVYEDQGSEYSAGFAVGYKFFLEEVASIVLSTVRYNPGYLVSDAVTQAQQVYGPGGVAVGRTSRLPANANLPGQISVALLLGLHPALSNLFLYPAHLPKYPGGSSESFTDSSAFDSGFSLNTQGGLTHVPTPSAPLLVHQGRLLFGAWFGPSTGSLLRVGTGVSIAAPERLAYTVPNSWYEAFDTALETAALVEDKPFGIGAALSMNANTLFVVKTNGGAYAVVGSLDAPNVIRLPGVASTGVARNVPCATPLGAVYGSTRGVWLWRGGADTSTNIAPQLDGWFWKPESADGPYAGVAEQMAGEVGSFGYQEPFVFAPNNWLWDMRTKSWWRFGNPNTRTYAWHSPSASGEMLCCVPYLFSGASPQGFIDWFDPSLGTSHYHFDGQPLQRTKGRQLNFRAIRLVAQGEGSLVITLTSISGEESKEEFFLRPESSLPHVMEKSINLTGQDCTFSIDAAGADYDSEAPTIYRLEFGYSLAGGQINVG